MGAKGGRYGGVGQWNIRIHSQSSVRGVGYIAADIKVGTDTLLLIYFKIVNHGVGGIAAYN